MAILNFKSNPRDPFKEQREERAENIKANKGELEKFEGQKEFEAEAQRVKINRWFGDGDESDRLYKLDEANAEVQKYVDRNNDLPVEEETNLSELETDFEESSGDLSERISDKECEVLLALEEGNYLELANKLANSKS
ncbi:unnamed protein product [marine sediment metagenome]|uniref:Uncharacterized protein n=1 Tax=marine sediment metagenome TaxID=412755 RepID=X1KZT1_9ZZZZ